MYGNYNYFMHFHFLKVPTAVILFVFLLESASVVRAQVDAPPPFAGSPYEVIDAVNALRLSYGLAPYRISPILMSSAQDHADYMAATGTVSHTGSGGSSVTDRLLAAGYPLAGDLSLGGFRSENITAGSEGMSAQTAVDQWRGDSIHLNTMISPSLTEIGAGVSVSGGRVYYVIDCAQPTNGGIAQDSATTDVDGATDSASGPAIVPVAVSTPNAAGNLIHEVKAGQTLWQIAISYGTEIDEIKRLNNLLDNDIYPGTKLLVKKGVFLSTTVVLASSTETSTVVPTLTATVSASVTAVALDEPSTLSTASHRSITGYVIGLVVIALFGGSLFMWLGNVKKE